MTYGEVEQMPSWERTQFIERINKRKREEAEAMSGKSNDLMREGFEGEAHGVSDADATAQHRERMQAIRIGQQNMKNMKKR